jgi:hypothetical protein
MLDTLRQGVSPPHPPQNFNTYFPPKRVWILSYCYVIIVGKRGYTVSSELGFYTKTARKLYHCCELSIHERGGGNYLKTPCKLNGLFFGLAVFILFLSAQLGAYAYQYTGPTSLTTVYNFSKLGSAKLSARPLLTRVWFLLGVAI